MMISIYSEMIPYHFTVNWYDFYRTDILHDFTAKNKIKSILVNSNLKGPSKTLWDIRTSTYQIFRTEENTNRTTKFQK